MVASSSPGAGRSWARVGLVATLHLGLFLVALFLHLDFSGVDGESAGLVSRLAGPFFWILGTPLWWVGLWLQDSVFMDRGVPDALEWGLLLANSLLWGIAVETLLRRRRACP